jgi:glycosyltransferase involved in cell wall biosynthesis
MPRVSVIIPSYNHEKYVAEAIESVLAQTYQDFEIIVTDDASSDGTVDVIKQFKDSRIKLFIFEKNQGASIAANHCIENATGELISLLNSDDIHLPNKLEIQVDFLDKHPDFGAVFSYPLFIDEESNLLTENHFYSKVFEQVNRNRFEWLNYFFYHGNCLCHPTILIKKKCYEDIGLYDPRFAQLPDFDFWIRLCCKYEIHIIPEALIKFRIRDNAANVSGRKAENYIRQSLELPQVYQNFLNSEVLENLVEIFPEIQEFLNADYEHIGNNSKLAQYYIAQLALQLPVTALHYFAIDLLFQLLSSSNDDSDKIQKLFNYKDLINLSLKYDPFQIKKEKKFSTLKHILFYKLRRVWLKLNLLLGLTSK